MGSGTGMGWAFPNDVIMHYLLLLFYSLICSDDVFTTSTVKETMLFAGQDVL